jgi:pimeloyl-ACP methyl ester carboxylesterase/lysophospholipase L1-like esterase
MKTNLLLTLASGCALHFIPLFVGSCVLIAATGLRAEVPPAPLRVACVGDCITFGAGTTFPYWESYPSQLQRMLGSGPGAFVGNFGIGGTNLLNSGEKPYQKQPALKSALGCKPDVVVIQLGTFDLRPKNWANKDQFAADYKDLIQRFQALTPAPRIFLSLPPVIPSPNVMGVNETDLLEEIALIKSVAAETGCGIIDVHAAFLKNEDQLLGKFYPNQAGAAVMAKTVYAAITGHAFEGEVPEEFHSKWGNYDRLDVSVKGRPALLVSPKKEAPGRPWIWRTEFFGAFPSVDLALLEKGWHVAYIDVQNLFGAPVALDAMDGFYDYLTADQKLSAKPVLEGFSRGGLFAFNWAARNPSKVGAIYVDAPVCDFKSWPAAKGKSKGSPVEWERCLKAYGFTEEQALAYQLNPIDNLAPIAAAKIPIIAVAGDADETVPVEENLQIVETRYNKLGGEIKVILKPGVGHHPHSLEDPTPVVDFLLAHSH